VLEETQGWEVQLRSTNFLEMLLNDKEATMQQLNKLCGNENVFFYTRILRRRILVEVAPSGIMQTPKVARKEIGKNRETLVRFKITSHFIKGKISLWRQFS